MQRAERFPFVGREGSIGEGNWLPFVPLQLRNGERSSEVLGLLDTGATVNVLPFAAGGMLGLSWEEQKTPLRLTGNLANYEARAVLLSAQVGSLPQVQLAFAWTRAEMVPVLCAFEVRIR